MAQVRYEVINAKGGWCIAAGDVLGPPYFRRTEAVTDAVAVGSLLTEFGDDVEVYVEEADGDLQRVDLATFSFPRLRIGEPKPPAGRLG